MYHNINIVLATKHAKEEAIREPFERAFAAKIFVPTDFDTDQFGTFTGEVIRQGTALDAVINKAKQAAAMYGYEYAIASEGSFGPHPTFFFAAADIEVMTFIDTKQNFIVTESEIFTETNYGHLDINEKTDYSDFLAKIKFGSHGLILKSADDHTILAKGITRKQDLDSLIKQSFKTYTNLRLETDMRAMMNPTRMKAIHQLTYKLISRIKTPCRACNAPGFGKVSAQGNLSCMACGMPTNLYATLQHSCIQCAHTDTKPRPDGMTHADPSYCPNCNP